MMLNAFGVSPMVSGKSAASLMLHRMQRVSIVSGIDWGRKIALIFLPPIFLPAFK